VRQSIEHVLEHEDRPLPCSANLGFPHLATKDLLPLKEKFLLDASFPSRSSCTQWGHHQLTKTEIAGAMCLPLWFSDSSLFTRWSKQQMGSDLPLKNAQTIMGLFLNRGVLGPPAVAPCSPPANAVWADNAVEDDFWIESLKLTQPGTWVESGVVSDKGAKANDAVIHTALWDQQIMLVFPHLTRKVLVVF
jgi:hypothetical protein